MKRRIAFFIVCLILPTMLWAASTVDTIETPASVDTITTPASVDTIALQYAFNWCAGGCTGTSDADIKCEDLTGSNSITNTDITTALCSDWSAVVDSPTTQSIDEITPHTDFYCDDFTTNGFQFEMDNNGAGSNEDCRIYHTFSADASVYGKFYYMMTQEGMSNGQYVNFFSLWGTNAAFALWTQDTNDQHRTSIRYRKSNDTYATVVSDETRVPEGVPLKFEWEYIAGTSIKVWIDDTLEYEICSGCETDDTPDNESAVQTMYGSHQDYSAYWTNTHLYQMLQLKEDGDTMPNDCHAPSPIERIDEINAWITKDGTQHVGRYSASQCQNGEYNINWSNDPPPISKVCTYISQEVGSVSSSAKYFAKITTMSGTNLGSTITNGVSDYRTEAEMTAAVGGWICFEFSGTKPDPAASTNYAIVFYRDDDEDGTSESGENQANDYFSMGETTESDWPLGAGNCYWDNAGVENVCSPGTDQAMKIYTYY